MDGLFKFFEHIANNYGISFAILFLVIILLILGPYFIIKSFPDLIKELIQSKIIEDQKFHKSATKHRRKVSQEIQKVLADLLEDLNVDRAILLEFTNGTSNLVGLPFLFLNATSEAISHNTVSVANIYQKINLSLMANCLAELEEKGYYLVEDIEDERLKHPVLHSFISVTNAKSLLFYPIFKDNLMFAILVVSSVRCQALTKEHVPRISKATQRLSSLLNLEELKQEMK